MSAKPLTVVVGATAEAFESAQALSAHLRKEGHQVAYVGASSPEDDVDYPDVASSAARALLEGRAQTVVLLHETGVGMSIAANKIQGIRAALCADPDTAIEARREADANVLCLAAKTSPADMVDTKTILKIADAWLDVLLT